LSPRIRNDFQSSSPVKKAACPWWDAHAMESRVLALVPLVVSLHEADCGGTEDKKRQVIKRENNKNSFV
jgi:hypothetical protein